MLEMHRGEPQGGCGARAGVNKEPRGAKISQTRRSRGDSSNPSTRGEDSNSFVDKNADRSPLGRWRQSYTVRFFGQLE